MATPIPVFPLPSIPIPSGSLSGSHSFHRLSSPAGEQTLGNGYQYGAGKEIVEDEDRWKPEPPPRMNRILSASDWLGHGHGTVEPEPLQELQSPYSEGRSQADLWSLPTSPVNKVEMANLIPDHIASHPLFSYHAASASNSYTSSPPTGYNSAHLLSTSAPSEMEDLPGPSAQPVSPIRRDPELESVTAGDESHASFWASRWAGVREQRDQTPATPARISRQQEGSLMEALSSMRGGEESRVADTTKGGEPFSPASAFLSNFSSPTLSAAGTGTLRRGGSMKSEVGWGGRIGESSVGRVARQASNERSKERNLSASPQDRFGYPSKLTPSNAQSGALFQGRSISPYRSFSLNPSTTAMAADEMSSAVSTTSSAPDAKGSKVLGYTLGKIIGRGGFSTVRLATDDETGEKFSCKIVKRDDLSDTSGSLENFELELELWKSLPRHPRILPLLETYRDPDGYATYLFSPYMAGGSLLDVVRRDGGSEETARRWFPGVVAAVQALHLGYDGFEGGMLHGDLKLDNFLVGHDGSICVCDFGLAQKLGKPSQEGETEDDEGRARGRSEGKRVIIESRPASRDRSRAATSRSRSRYRQMTGFPSDYQHAPHHSQSGFVEGRRAGARHSPSPAGRWGEKVPNNKSFPSASLPYAPPEILSAPPSGPSLAQDVWALGIILHALLTSRLPFVDTFDPRLQMKILRGDWTIPSHLGSEWLGCLLGCLEGDKTKRWTIKQLAESDALQGWRHVKSRSRSRSRARSINQQDERSLSVSPSSDMRSLSRGRRELQVPGNAQSRDRSRDARSSSKEHIGARIDSQTSSRATSVPRRPRSAYDTPPTSGSGLGLPRVAEAGDDVVNSIQRLTVGKTQRSRSRGRQDLNRPT